MTVRINIVWRDIGIDPLAPQLIINWRMTHGATP
jgi:hypothetical protein